MTPEIEACFEAIEAVMRFQPKREFSIFPSKQHRFLAASVEVNNPGSGGFYFIFSYQTDPKFVSVLWQPIAMNSTNFRWYCTPLLSGLTFFVTV